MLNPFDFYLWLSEEIQTFDWDSNSFGTRFGIAANFIFLLARANSGAREEAFDDVFGDAPANSWLTYVVNFLVWTLGPISLLNAFYTMTRSREYRLFEANVETGGPSTPSAHRVRVDSSPVSSASPLRLIQEISRAESANARAHPDKTRDVWEMSVWNPYPATLRIFCLFSPGHVLIHWLFLPLTQLDPRPSVTVFKCLILQIILSSQLLVLTSRFSQQAKDTAIIHREVMHEYDVKYVHPRLHPVVREVGTQVSIGGDVIEEESVAVGTPSTIIRRGFQTHPNLNYAKHFDPDGAQPQPRKLFQSPRTSFAGAISRGTEPLASTPQVSRPSSLRQSLPSPSVHRISAGAGPAPVSTSTQSSLQQTPLKGPTALSNYPGSVSGTNFGGSLGVYSHMNSPLKKASSMGEMNNSFGSPRNSREMAAMEQRETTERMIRQGSPLKDRRATSTAFEGAGGSLAHSPDKLANLRANRWTQERFPTRRL